MQPFGHRSADEHLGSCCWVSGAGSEVWYDLEVKLWDGRCMAPAPDDIFGRVVGGPVLGLGAIDDGLGGCGVAMQGLFAEN